jgi:DNA-binding HxlR family transcriptional regulator
MIISTVQRSNRSVPKKTGCAVESALALIGGRWKGVVIYRLLQGTQRFSTLRRELPSCSPRMLTLQLRELEQDGLVKRTVYAEVPPRVEYDLTPFGRTLEPVIMGLCEWGQLYKRKIERALSE